MTLDYCFCKFFFFSQYLRFANEKFESVKTCINEPVLNAVFLHFREVIIAKTKTKTNIKQKSDRLSSILLVKLM